MNSTIKDFEIIKEIGKGSFATVSIVRRKADKKVYAMKKVKIGTMGNKEKENALNEVRLLASINSPQVIGYKEAFFDEETQTLNIVMEYADDEDLDKKIKNRAKANYYFKEDEIWFFTIQIVKGLKSLHEKKIMHRDLKSANIFLTKTGGVKIGDLNVSKLVKEKMAYTQTGTPYYASPEVWADISYDYKSDVWSLGCIVYEMCCLKTPFRAKGLNELFEVVTKGVYSSIPEIYSEKLSDLIKKMLVVDPINRISCQEILKLDYVIEKIEFFKNNLKNNNLMESQTETNDLMLNTIKVPNNLSEIPNSLPKKTNYYDTLKEFNIDVIEDKFCTVDYNLDSTKNLQNIVNNSDSTRIQALQSKSPMNSKIKDTISIKYTYNNNNNNNNDKNMLILNNGEKNLIKNNIVKTVKNNNYQVNKSSIITISDTDKVILVSNQNKKAYDPIYSQKEKTSADITCNSSNNTPSKVNKTTDTSLISKDNASNKNFISSNQENILNKIKTSALENKKDNNINLNSNTNNKSSDKLNLFNSRPYTDSKNNINNLNEWEYNRNTDNKDTNHTVKNLINTNNNKINCINTRNLSDNKTKNISQNNTNNGKNNLTKNIASKSTTEPDSEIRSKTPITSDISISIKKYKNEILKNSKSKPDLKTIGESGLNKKNLKINNSPLLKSINANKELYLKYDNKISKKNVNSNDTIISNKSKDKSLGKENKNNKEKIIQNIKNINNKNNSNIKLITNNNNYHVNSKIPNSINTINTIQTLNTMNNETVEYETNLVTKNNNTSKNFDKNLNYSNKNYSYNNNNNAQNNIIYSVKQSNSINIVSNITSKRALNNIKGVFIYGSSKGNKIDSSSTRKIPSNICNNIQSNRIGFETNLPNNSQTSVQSPISKLITNNRSITKSGEKNNKMINYNPDNSPHIKYYQNSSIQNNPKNNYNLRNLDFISSNKNVCYSNKSNLTPPKTIHYSSNSGSGLSKHQT
jgi:NIMA (never in mitosis gene a)-related kinase